MLNYLKHNLLISFSIMMKNWLLLRNIPISRLEYKNHTLFTTKMAKMSLSRYPIYDQNGRKTKTFGRAHASIKKYPPPPPHSHPRALETQLRHMSNFVSCYSVDFSNLHRKQFINGWRDPLFKVSIDESFEFN